MSDTMKAIDSTRKAQDNAARAGQGTAEATARVGKEAVGSVAGAAEATADRARQATETLTDNVSEAADTAASASLKTAATGRDTMLMGARTAAGVTGKVADISFNRSRDMVASSAQAMDIYTGAAERTAERVQALMSSGLTLSRGMQKMQHAWLEMVDQTMERAAHRPQDLLRCKTLVEVAEVQRDLYTDAVNHAFETSSRLLELAASVAQDAVRPLRAHSN